jgi:flagellar motor switch protein FliN
MTEANASSRQSGPAEFLEVWSATLSQVLGKLSASPVAGELCAEKPAEFPLVDSNDLWVVITSAGALRGEMSLRLTAVTVLHLAQIFLSEPPTPDVPLTASHREAVIELLRQVAGIVTTTAKAKWGEVQIGVEQSPAAPSWPPAGTFWVQVGEPGPTAITLEFGLSAALAAELKVENAEEESAKVIAGFSAPVKPTVPSTAVPANLIQGTGTFDLLMEVELAMTMRFGARRLLLREVLDLSPGAVIELDRKVQESVDLLLDGRLVARGEVVVIGGSYGLRVTEVSPLSTA